MQRHVETLEAVSSCADSRRTSERRQAADEDAEAVLRDSGLLRHLLNISSLDELDNHPSRSASWEGFVLEDVLRRERVARPASQAWYWRTAAAA